MSKRKSAMSILYEYDSIETWNALENNIFTGTSSDQSGAINDLINYISGATLKKWWSDFLPARNLPPPAASGRVGTSSSRNLVYAGGEKLMEPLGDQA
jgi:hypothetical protein